MSMIGTLYNWNDDRGFGFVKPDNGNKDVFVHIKAFYKPAHRPQNGDILRYEITERDGKLAAINVRFANSPKTDTLGLSAFKQRPMSSLILGGLCLFYIIYFMISFPVLIVFPIILSVVTYLVYAKDKAASQAGKQRTPENTLHSLSLLGGWPGAFIAQSRLRHKLRKPSFMSVYWLTVILNFGIFLLVEAEVFSQFLNKLHLI